MRPRRLLVFFVLILTTLFATQALAQTHHHRHHRRHLVAALPGYQPAAPTVSGISGQFQVPEMTFPWVGFGNAGARGIFVTKKQTIVIPGQNITQKKSLLSVNFPVVVTYIIPSLKPGTSNPFTLFADLYINSVLARTYQVPLVLAYVFTIGEVSSADYQGAVSFEFQNPFPLGASAVLELGFHGTSLGNESDPVGEPGLQENGNILVSRILAPGTAANVRGGGVLFSPGAIFYEESAVSG